MRDTDAPGTKAAKLDPMLPVTSDNYALFRFLPKGIDSAGDAKIEVHSVADADTAEKLRESLVGSLRNLAGDPGAYKAKVQKRIDRMMGRLPPLPAEEAPAPKEKPPEIQAKIERQLGRSKEAKQEPPPMQAPEQDKGKKGRR